MIDAVGMFAGTMPASGGAAEAPQDEEALFARVLATQLRSALPDEALGGEWGDAFGPLLDDLLAEQLADQLRTQRAGRPSSPTGATTRAHAHPHAEGHERPVPGPAPTVGRVTSAYGHRIHPLSGQRALHHGVDLAAPRGTPIQLARAGTVVRAGPAGGYGNLVEIDHGDGVVTRYAHCDRLDVAPGQELEPGTRLGTVGNTGRSTGPHLHFEVRIEGKAVDPQNGRWNDLFPQIGDEVGR